VRAEDVVAWWMDAFALLHRTVRGAGLTRSGWDGALFPQEFFTDEHGDIVEFVPVTEQVSDGSRVPARVRPYDVEVCWPW